MKVLHVIPSVGPSRGGPSVVVRALTRGLAQAGIEVHVAATDDDGPERLNVPLSVPVEEDRVMYRYFSRQTRLYTFSWPLTQWLARHTADYDVVHIHALFSYSTGAAAWQARRHGVPYVVRPLGTLNRWGVRNRRPMSKRISFSLLERYILSSAAAIHYTSEQERMEAEELGVCTRAVVIPNPTDSGVPARDAVAGRFRDRYPQVRGRKVVLFLSRLDPIKGLDLLLPAFAALRERQPDAFLVVAGEGEAAFTTGLKQKARELGISGDVLWAGHVKGEEKWAALADADVFALPSYSENFGVAVVEAMAMGTPVVVSDQVGIHREIREADAGLVTPCEECGLTAALGLLLSDAAMRQRMGPNGQRLVRTVFSAAAVTEQILALYREVTGRSAMVHA